ncbi:putative binding protein BRA0576/BS1330_II0571 [Azospirillaceae bacterium]
MSIIRLVGVNGRRLSPEGLWLLCVLTLLHALPSWAQETIKEQGVVFSQGVVAHGIAMHGKPKYSFGFSAFDYVNPNAPKGGRLRQSASGSFDSLNPFIVRGRSALGANEVFETLMARAWDEPFSLYGLVAESIETPLDRSWVTFRLRPQARWRDGASITADDVLFSWRTLRDFGRPNHRAYYSRVSKAERLDERAVRFEFQPGPDGKIDRELPLIMGLMPLLAEHDWKGKNFDQTTLTPPLGSGPYQLTRLEPGRMVEYRRLPDYWGRDLPVRRGQFNFDVIRYDYYRDEGVAREAFKAGEVDFRREFDPNRWATGYDFPAARDGRVVREAIRHGRPEPMRGFIFNARRSPLDDVRVREALIYAFDFEWINRQLFHSAYHRIKSFYPNSELAAPSLPDAEERAILESFDGLASPEIQRALSLPLFTPSTDGSGPTGLRVNLRRAGELLTSAGWSIQDGRRVDASERPMRFEILLNNPADEKIALEFTRSLARLGIEARVRTVDSAQFQARLDRFDYDLVLHQWSSTLSPGNEQLIYFGSTVADVEGSRNYAGIRSPVVDQLASSFAQATDRADLVRRIHALDRVLLLGRYVMPLFYLGEDRVAYWNYLRRPKNTPVYGVLTETWWSQDEATN